MKKRRLAYWLCLLPYGITYLGIFLAAVQFLILGLIHHGPHGEVRERPYFVPRRIEDVFEEGGRIYLLYQDSGAVNVYDSEGQFQWAVSIPWHDHTSEVRIRVNEDSLFLYQRDYDVYQFDPETGALLASFPLKGREEEFPDECAPREEDGSEWEPGDGVYNGLSAYRIGEDGKPYPLIRRSPWIQLLYFEAAWLISVTGMVGTIPAHLVRTKMDKKAEKESQKGLS